MSVGLAAVGDNGLAIQSGDGKTWAVQTTPVSTRLNGVRYAQGQFMAPGQGGVVITSPTGVAWTSQTTGTTQALFKPWFSDNLWVVPGDNVVRRSADGVTWLGVAGPFAVDQNAVAKNLTTYVLVADGGSVATSADAISWASQTSGTANDLLDVVYAPWLALYVAVGDAGTIITSPDGVTWTTRTSNTSSDLRTVTIDQDNQRVVAAGQNGTIVTSTDGIVWVPRASSTTTERWEGSFFDQGLYVVVGSFQTTTQIINTSLDSTTWALESGAGTDALLAVSGSLPPGAADGAGGGGYGRDSWGVDPWGSIIPQPPLTLDRAVALTTKEVEVTLNRAAQVVAPTVVGDALNPATWIIQRLDTGFLFSVLLVTQTDEEKFVLSVLQDWGPVTASHRVLSTTLLDGDGNPISQPPLNRVDFDGLLASEAKDALTRARGRSNAVRDIANPPTPASPVGGTLVINSGGDYELESGSSLLKKLIIRRLITRKGGFFHLPDYGVGLGVKELLPATNLIKLRADIIRQIQREREVTEANARLTLSPQNELTVRVKARVVTGEDVDFSFPVGPNQIVL